MDQQLSRKFEGYHNERFFDAATIDVFFEPE